MKRIDFAGKLIYFAFFFFTPLIFLPYTSEIFEFNKMAFTYFIAILLSFLLLLKIIFTRKIALPQTFWNPFLIFFLASQLICTVFSMDLYSSLYGPFNRFQQGIFSLLAYLVIYFGFQIFFCTTNHRLEKQMIEVSILASAFLSTAYAFVQKFGFDPFPWVQSVETRTFSTLGQPNWLGAYLAIVLLIVCAKLLDEKTNFWFWPLTTFYYCGLLFTRSRSAFAAFHFCFIILAFVSRKQLLFKRKLIILLAISILLIKMFNLFPFSIDQLTKVNIFHSKITGGKVSNLTPTSVISGGTESGEIRKIVWAGAINAWKQHPWTGTGVETYGLAFNLYKPIEQNLTSEWDFLYNKAHNEYLNYLATTGLIGTLAYLGLIFSFIWYFFHLPKKNLEDYGYFLAWISILITNFFGFSTVVISLFLYLIPGWFFLREKTRIKETISFFGWREKIEMGLAIIYLLLSMRFLISWYLADIFFTRAQEQVNANNYYSAIDNYEKSLSLNYYQPYYHSSYALILADAAKKIAADSENFDMAKKTAREAVAQTDIAVKISPNNSYFWANKAVTLANLETIDKKYQKSALKAITNAQKLSPQDPRMAYNRAILFLTNKKIDQALEQMELALKLKPNYLEAAEGAANLYNEIGNKRKAYETVSNLLKYYPADKNITKLTQRYKP